MRSGSELLQGYDLLLLSFQGFLEDFVLLDEVIYSREGVTQVLVS